jgi:hypothetical protein
MGKKIIIKMGRVMFEEEKKKNARNEIKLKFFALLEPL